MSDSIESRAVAALNELLSPLLTELRKVDQGLSNLLDAIRVLDTRVGNLEAELTKELPPSKTADVLEELVDSVDLLSERMAALTDTILDGREDADADPEAAKHGHEA